MQNHCSYQTIQNLFLQSRAWNYNTILLIASTSLHYEARLYSFCLSIS